MLDGIHTLAVRVEADISTGLPAFDMVGYLSAEVREAKERVRTALHNIGIALPAKRITVNLSPADVRKTGTGFDLPIAIAIMSALQLIDAKKCEGVLFSGELNLKGELLPVRGMLPIVSDGVALGIKKFIVPAENEREGRLVKQAEVLGFSTLEEVLNFLWDESKEPKKPQTNVKTEELTNVKMLDFSEVNGQTYLRRAAEVAASGMHNMLMVGPPGAGKTMISERIATILPPLTEEEQLEVSKIYSVCGLLRQQESLIKERPFRSPHHTISGVGLAGGGSLIRPGEISLAHNGVLFLDELTEFNKSTLEILRQPLEDKEINIVRASGSITYPAQFLLLASMNPCNCGYYPDRNRCRCSEASLRRYYDRVSQPLLDRMDICVDAPNVSYEELTKKGINEDSKTIRERVVRCHELERRRFSGESFMYNSRIPAALLEKYCPLGEKEQSFMERMYEKMSLTARTYHKLLRVARTIADLEESGEIRLSHLKEAVCYRSFDARFRGGEV
jgi:magnesium chelatase family protein